MAEALFQRKLLELYPWAADFTVVDSCGTSAVEGNPSTVSAVQAMDLWGIDLEPHRASPLSSSRLEEADLVLAMAREHLLSIERILPRALDKSTTLSYMAEKGEEILRSLGKEAPRDEKGVRDRLERALELLRSTVPGGSFLADMRREGSDIIDPIGSDLQVYISVAEDIDRSLDGIMPVLFGPPGV